MIDTSYLKVLQEQDTIMNEYFESVEEIDAIVNPITVAGIRRNQEMELGIFTESADDAYMESVKDAVTTLGNKIIEIINRIKDFIKSIPTKIKESSWNKADTDKKMEMVKKKDPKRYNEIKVYVDKGMLDFNSFKSMNEFYANFDDLMTTLEKKDADEKSIRGKFEKLKKTFENNKKTVEAVAASLGLIATGATIAVNYVKFRNETDKRIADEVKRTADEGKKRVQKMEIIEGILNDKNNPVDGHYKATIAANANLLYEQQTKLHVSKLTALRSYIGNHFDKIATSLSKDKDLDKKAAAAKNAYAKDITAEHDRLKDVVSNATSRYLNRTESVGDIYKHNMSKK